MLKTKMTYFAVYIFDLKSLPNPTYDLAVHFIMHDKLEKKEKNKH